MNAVFKEIN